MLTAAMNLKDTCSLEEKLWKTYLLLLFSHSVMSNFLWPHELQHARLPCPSPLPRAWSTTCPLSQLRHSAISSSVIPFSSFLQSLPASGFFLLSALHMRWPNYCSFSFNISTSNEYSVLISFRTDCLISSQSKGLMGKDPDTGNYWRHEEKEERKDDMAWCHQLNKQFGKLWEAVKDRNTLHAVVHGVTKGQICLKDWTTAMVLLTRYPYFDTRFVRII